MTLLGVAIAAEGFPLMILAQSVAEYGVLSSVVAGIQHAAYDARQWIEDQGPAAWFVILALLAVILIVRRRRRS